MTSEGEMVVRFNQKMIAPGKIIPRSYKKVFIFSIVSDLDGRVTFGKIVDSKDVPNYKKTGGRKLDEVTKAIELD